MAINPYFKLYDGIGNANEQALVQDMVEECIQIHGVDVQYLPRTLLNEDELFNESVASAFKQAHTIEMLIKNFEGGSGDDALMQFGLQVNDTLTLSVASRRFTRVTTLDRPNEGDLIYLPLTKQLYEIKFAEDEEQFYALGDTPTFEVRCELFEYSGEDLATGIASIDAIETDIDAALNLENDAIETEALLYGNFDENNPFGDVRG